MLSKLDIFTKVCWYFYVINFYFFYVQPCTTILFVTILNQSRDTTIMIMSALYMYMAIVAFVYLSFLYLDWRVNPQWTTSQTKSSELFSTYFLYIHTHTHTSRTIQFCFFLCRKKNTHFMQKNWPQNWNLNFFSQALLRNQFHLEKVIGWSTHTTHAHLSHPSFQGVSQLAIIS